MWERTHKTNHSQQHFKLIFKSVVDEVLTFITLQNTKNYTSVFTCSVQNCKLRKLCWRGETARLREL